MKIKSVLYGIGIYSFVFGITAVYAQEVIEQISQEETSVQEILTQATTTDTQNQESFENIFDTNIEADDIKFNLSEILVEATTTELQSSSTTSFENIVVNNENEIHVFIRNGESIIVDSSIIFSEEEMIEVIDMEGGTHQILANSVLGALVRLDQENNSFEISKLQYYDFYGSFYIKCLTIEEVELCDNWQYVVNNVSPWEGIELAKVSPEDSVGLYFGNPYQIVFSTSTYQIDTPFVAAAQKYNYITNTWEGRSGVSIGLTVPNPDDIWSPIELVSIPVDVSGNATFTIATSGAYSVGVKEDYYYPSYPIIVSSSSNATSTDTSSNSGGSGTKKNVFDIEAAIAFIKNLQGSDGSYGSSELYSDWVAVAFGSDSQKDQKLESYLKSKSTIKSMITDNERRVMAILSLDKNPYNFNGTNYIKVILDSFDGIQIGDKNLVNDDIFGILVLGKSGYTSNDDEIKKTTGFIVSKQNPNGSWENSIDLTAAAIQALYPFSSISGVSGSITKAKNYLKSNQQEDGGWGNVYSTSWASMAMNELNENWTKGSNTTEIYLSKMQQEDGGVLDVEETKQNRIWATSYVIPAVIGKTWNDILNSVSKEILNESNISSGGGDSNTSSTTTLSVATTTVLVEQISDEEIASSSISITSLETNVSYQEQNKNSLELNLSNVQEENSVASGTKDVVEDSQLASVQNISLSKKWILYIFVLVLILGGTGYIVLHKK